MELTFLSFIIIPLGLIMFFMKIEYLLGALVFFSAFPGASVLEVNFISYNLEPAYYLGMLFLVKYFFTILKENSMKKPNLLFSGFVILSFLSLIMPYLIKDFKVLVINADAKWGYVHPSLSNITQFLYLLFDFLIYWFLLDYLRKNIEQKNKLLKIFLWSALFICMLGIYQEIAYYFGLPFDVYFRQNSHGNIQYISNGLVRMYSVFLEPSMFAIFILSTLGLVTFIPKSIFKYKAILIFLLIMCGVLSSSTTFIAVFPVYVIIVIFDIFFNGTISIESIKNILKIFLVAGVIFSAVLIVLNSNERLKYHTTTNVVRKFKGESSSGKLRKESFVHHVKVGLKYPVLGVGFGSTRSFDFFSTIFANVGLSGIIFFLGYILYLLHKVNQLKNEKGFNKSFVTFIILVFLSLGIICFPFMLFIWIIISIAESYVLEDTKEEDIEYEASNYIY